MYYILDTNLRVAGLLSLEGSATPFYNDLITRKIADNSQKIWSDTLDINVPYGTNEVDLIEIGNHILAPSDDNSKWFVYRIYDIEDELVEGGIHTRKASCYNLAIWDFYHTQIEAKTFSNSLVNDIIKYALQGTSWHLEDLDTYFDGEKTFELSEGTVQSAIDTIIQTFECEVEAYVVLKNGQVFDKVINFVEKLGNDDKKFRFEYSRNLTGVTRKKSDLELYTKLYVYGGTNSKDQRVSIASVNDGKEFLLDDEANDLYNAGNKYLEGAVTRESILNPSGLLVWGKKQLEFYNHPHFEYTVDVALIDEDVELGDSADIIDDEMSPELYLQARVIEVQISQSDITANKIVFGDFIEVDVVKPSSIWALQSLASQALEKANSASTWKVELFTPEGTDFENTTDKKTVVARVYDGMTNITYELEQTSFVWQMTDSNGIHNEEWENAHIGIGNVIEVGQEVAGYTITCSIDDATAENPLFFALESDFSFFSKLENNNSTITDLNVKVGQYAVVEPVNHNIYWSQIYEGSKLTASDISKGESFSITRTDMNGLILDRMELKNGGHGSHFGVAIENGKVMIYSNIKDIYDDTAFLCKFPYQAGKMLSISDSSIIKLVNTTARTNVDFKNDYYLFVDNKADKVQFKISPKHQTDITNKINAQYILTASDFGVQENQIYQSSALDFPYLYVTYGGTNGTANNGDTPVLYCIDVRSASVVYKINYTFTTDAIVPEDNHHEAETISIYFENGQKWIVQGFAFTNDDEALKRRNNVLYRVKETFRA